VSSYLISDGAFVQRFGDLAGSLIVEKPGLTLKVILANATKPESIFVPYVTEYIGTANYTDSASLYVRDSLHFPRLIYGLRPAGPKTVRPRRTRTAQTGTPTTPRQSGHDW
jgi:hypothetical protein